jgi:hypothetical protein
LKINLKLIKHEQRLKIVHGGPGRVPQF